MRQGISIREFARRDGCNDRLVRDAVKSGRLKAFDDGSLDGQLVGTGWRKGNRDAAEATAANAESLRIGADETPAEAAERIVSTGGRIFATKAEAERHKESYNALLRELEFDQALGAVALIEDVQAEVTAAYLRVKTRLLAIGAELTPQLAPRSEKSAAEIKGEIDAYISEILRELSRADEHSADVAGVLREGQGEPSEGPAGGGSEGA